MLVKIIILSLVFTQVINLTTLTSSNCPSDFNPANYNTTQTSIVSLYANAFKPELQAQIQNSFTKGDMHSLLTLVVSNSFLLPFILAAAIFALLFVCISCCCLFQKRCPPCESWRRNYLKYPYSRCQLTSVMILAALFFLGALVTTIVVFSSFTLLQQDLKMIKCGIYYGIDVAVNGDQSNGWGGFGQIQGQISNVTALLTSAAAAVNSTLTGGSWILSSLQTIQNMNLNLWNNNNQSGVLTPDPIATANAINNNTAIPKITPLFIKQGLGPNGTVGTMVTDIDSSLQNTQKLSTKAQISYESAQLMANSAANVIVNTNINLQGITIASTYLSSIQAAIQNFSSEYLDTSLTTGIYIVQAIFGVIVLGSLIALMGVISTHVFDILRCGKLVLGGWVLLGFSFFGVLGVLLVWLAVGGIGTSFCQYYESIISSSDKLLIYSEADSSSSFNKFFFYLNVCLFGDGNILKEFSMSQEMKTVSDVFVNIQSYLDMQTSGNTQFVDQTQAPTKILTWMNVMNQYVSGIYIDADNTITDNSNPYVALAHFNQRTMQSSGIGNSTCANDYWVFDASNCTYNSTQSLYTPSSDSTNGLYIPAVGTLCIALNSRLSTSSPSIWSTSDIAYRYLSVRSCKTNSTTAYNQILAYAQSLTNYRDTHITLYQSLYNQLNAMLTFTNAYNSNLTQLTAQFNTFFSTVSALNSIVTNQINGLSISANCSAIAGSLQLFYDVFCVNFIQRSVKIAICCMVLLGMMTGAVIAGSLFAVRYERVDKIRKFNGETQDKLFSQSKIEQSQSSISSEQEEGDT